MGYSLKTGVGKSIKNAVLPAIATVGGVLIWVQQNCNLNYEVAAGTGITLAFVVGLIINFLKNRG